MTDGERTDPRDLVSTLAVLAGFFVLGLLGVLRHEMWRDEMEIWLIARDSASPFELLANMATEGHPVLWYAITWVVARFAREPLLFQLLSLAVGTAAAFVVLRYAPFSWLQRLLFCFGYYLFYEFTIIGRSYGLLLLLGYSFCALYARVRRLEWRGALLLVLLANTHLYGAIGASAIVLLSGLDGLRAGGLAGRLRDTRWLLAAGIVGLGVLTSLAHIWTQYVAIGPGHLTTYQPTWDLPWLTRGVATVFYGICPLPNPLLETTWNSSFLQLLPGESGSAVAALLALGVMAACARTFRRRPHVQAVFWLGAAVQLGLTLVTWYGSLRHHGQFFLWSLLCCWLATIRPEVAENEAEAVEAWRPPGAALTLVLVLQVLAGAFAYTQDLVRPFSNAKALAAYLSRPETATLSIVGSIDYAMQPVVGYLDRAIWYPESDRFGTFLDWSDARRLVPADKAIGDAVQLTREQRRDVILVLNHPPRGLEPGALLPLGGEVSMTYVAAFTGAIVADENYHVYRVQAAGVSSDNP